ncbi:conserved Plasmodium protein, unknown function, partial [Plasmodium gallinaceum]
RENNSEDDKKYINLSFANDLIKIPKGEIRLRQKDYFGRKYNFTYNDKKNKKNYEYINSTNEYYITKNVQEKMSNTGITTENFFCDNDVLVYEDDMNTWNDKSRYLYFINKEKENNVNKKQTKFKNIHFNDSVLVDKYERVAYKNDVVSDKIKIENLILDVLNNNFDDIESEEDKKSQVSLQIDQLEDEKLEIRKKVEELNIKKKKKIKDKKTNILDYLHYDNFFYDENADRITESSTSDDSDNLYNKKNAYLKNNTFQKTEEGEIKNNVNNLLTKVKDDLNIRTFSNFIPEKFNTEIFLYDNEKYHKYETFSNQKSNQVLTQTKIEMNKEKMKEESELLQKYNYDDSLYSPGYYTRITQNLRKKLKEEKINIYDLKKKKIYDKIREDMIEDEKMKKEEENLTRLRLENIKIYDEDLIIEETLKFDNNEEELTKLSNVKKEKDDKDIKDEKDEIDEDDDDINEEVSESEDSIQTNSSLSFEYLDHRSIDNLKKKYKVMKKSDRVYEDDLRKLKFYICNRLNKKKYILKPKLSNKIIKEKKKNVKKVMKFSKEAGFNLLAKIHREDDQNNEEESEESELFEDEDKNPSDLNSSEYTYSSLTISSYEYLDIRNVYYNANANEKAFYFKDPKINITYLYSYVDFFLINNDVRINKGNLFIEILVYYIKLYENSTHISEDSLLYSLQINENITAKIEKKDNNISDIILKVVNEDGDIINCCLSGNADQINLIFNNIITRVLLVKYTKYLNSLGLCVYENAVYYFLTDESILNLKNINYDKNADEIICSYKKKIKNLKIIDFSNRKMNILNLFEFLTFSNIKQCNTLIITKNPLFLDLSFDTIKNNIDDVIIFLKNINLTELVLDFIDFSNTSAEYFIANLIIKTNISSLSLMNCGLNEDNITNIIKNIKEEKGNISSCINYLNVEFNNLNYFGVLSLIRTLYELNNDFKKLYIYGNIIQRDIFNISFEFKKKKQMIETDKYFKHIPNIFSFNNIYEIKNYLYCNIRGFAQFYESDNSKSIFFELYNIYLYILKPEIKLYIIKNISIAEKDDLSFLLIVALYNNKEIKFRLKLFKHNITLLFYNVVNESFLGKLYYYEQINNNREINENVLNYFIMRSENEINFYHYNINKEEIDYILKLCKNSVVKYLNLSYCYLTNEDILYFNSIKGSKYGINTYKLSLSNNFINSNLPIEELINFLSNFSVYFKINLSDLKIGRSPNIHEMFFYLLNNTKCKIINLNNCNLGNSFLINVNKNIEKLNVNNYLTLLLLQYNKFSNEKELVNFLNNLISKCKSIDKIKIYSNTLHEENCENILNSISRKEIVSFHHTYDPSMDKKNLKKKVSKLKKNKINNDIHYDIALTENERNIIEKFFEKKQNRERKLEKKDFKLKSRYNLMDLKNRKIKYNFKK